MSDRPTSTYVYVVRDQGGDYSLAGQVGEERLYVGPMSPSRALTYARWLGPLPTDAVIQVSNVAADDVVVAALRGDR